jgi:sugar phosphate isomerase/epimerase
MKQSLHSFMKPGIVFHMLYPKTMGDESCVPEYLEKLASNDFFDVIEVIRFKDDTIKQKAKKILDSSHAIISYGVHVAIFQQKLNLNTLDEVERKRVVDIFKAEVDEAYAMNAVDFTFVCGQYEEDKKEEALAALIKSTKEICEYAKAKGNLKIIHEQFDYDVDKKVICGPVDMAVKYAEAMKDYDNFGLLVDLSHLPLLRETPRESILPIKEYLIKGGHAHMGNTIVSLGDTHPRFGYLGSSNDVEQLTEYLKVLLEIGFLNEENPPILSFEIKTYPDESPDVTLASAIRTLRAAWAKA